MKKILFILLLIFIGQNVQSQVFFTEDFESGTDANNLPSAGGWQEQGFSSDGVYMIGDFNAAFAGGFWFVDPHSNFVMTNDDNCNCDKSEDRLILPAQDFSTFTGTVTLTSDYTIDAQFGGIATVEVSIDGGISWQVVSTFTSNAPDSGDWTDGDVVDLTAFIGQSNVLISFLYNDEFNFALGLGIDNVILTKVDGISVDVTTDCVNGTGFTFTDDSQQVITDWFWDFGAGATPANSTAEFPPVVTYSTPGFKTISLTRNFGAESITKTNFIEVMDVPTVDNIPGGENQTVCNGNMTNPIDLIGSDGGSGLLDFTWSYTTVPAGQNIGIGTSGTGDIPAFSAVNASASQIVATFTVIPTNNGCNGSPYSITITVNPIDDATFSYVSTSFCVGSANEVLGAPTVVNGTFSSTTPGFVDAVTGELNISAFPAATYDVTYLTNGSCPNSSTLNISIITSPFVNNPGNQTLCGNSATTDVLFTGSAATQFDWVNTNTSIGLAASGTGDILSFVATNSSGVQQTASITVTPSAGTCSGTSEVFTFTVDPTPTFSYSQGTYCLTDPDPTPSATPAGGVFSSNPAGIVFADAVGTIDISASTAGPYNIDYFVASCNQTLTVPVSVGIGSSTVNPISNVVVCDNVNTTDIFITGSVGATFTWTNDNTSTGLAASGSGDILAFLATNSTASPIVSNVTVTPDDGTCPGTPITFTITVNPGEDASFSMSVVSSCSNDVPNAPVTTVTGDPGGVFSAGAGLVINANTGAIDVVTSTPGIYTVVYTTSGICPTSTSLGYELIETPVISAISDIDTCSGIFIPTIGIAALSTFSIDWTNDNTSTGLSSASGTGDIPGFTAVNAVSGGPSDTSHLTLISTNNGCVSNTVLMNIIVRSLPTVGAGSDKNICEGTAITMSGTGTASSFTWDNGITNGVAFTPSAGTFIYTVTGTTNGCSRQDQATVTVKAAPIVDAGLDRVVCTGSQVTLTATGAPTLSWNNGVTDNVPFVPSVAGDYIVTGVAANGCSKNDTLVLTIEALPIPSFTSNVNMGCIPTTVIFNSSATTNGCVYSYSDGTFDVGCTNVSHTFTSAGLYDVTLTQTSINGCIGSTIVQAMIIINPDPVSAFTVDRPVVDMIDPITPFQNNSQGALTYEWNFGDNLGLDTTTNPIHAFPGDTPSDFTVSLVAISNFGCKDTSFAVVTVEESVIFYISNSFTPNGDEINNTFNPLLFAGFDPQDYNMKIFDRFGEQIFETNDISYGWDGDYGAGRGLAPGGTYTYKLQFNTPTKDEKKVVVGHINLIR